jgi:hypothetical protein
MLLDVGQSPDGLDRIQRRRLQMAEDQPVPLGPIGVLEVEVAP